MYIYICCFPCSNIFRILSRRIRAAELEAVIAEVRGGDEATAMRKLVDMLRTLRLDLKAARQMAEAALEAAGKCQVCDRRLSLRFYFCATLFMLFLTAPFLNLIQVFGFDVYWQTMCVSVRVRLLVDR